MAKNCAQVKSFCVIFAQQINAVGAAMIGRRQLSEKKTDPFDHGFLCNSLNAAFSVQNTTDISHHCQYISMYYMVFKGRLR
jgi:hypothetical protein